MELIDGAEIKMGGKLWVVPALSFKQVKRLLPTMGRVGSGNVTPENMGDMAEVVHAALSRNYPDVTLDDVEDMLDLSNALSLFLAVMGQSGMEMRQQGEAQAGSR